MRPLVRKCDIIYHLAAAVGVKYILDNPVGSLTTNIEGTHLILRLAVAYRKKVVLASTSEVYGKHRCLPIGEKDDRVLGSTSVGRWSYSEAKAIDEFLALAYANERKLKVVIVRFFNTVGPRQTGRYGMVLPRFIQEALSGTPITVYGDGAQIRTFTYIKDAVRATIGLSVCKKAEGEAFNVGTNQSITMNSLARRIKKATHSASPIVHISYKKAFGKASANFEDMRCRIPDITKIKRVIGFRPQYDIGDIIDNTIRYFTGTRKKT